REPMEEGRISISRSQGKVDFPADFILVAAFNPCPCGYLGTEKGDCNCTANEVNRYRKKLSGPIMDRIDLWCNVESVPHRKLSSREKNISESTKKVRSRIKKALSMQKRRISPKNKESMDIANIATEARLSEKAEEILILSAEKMDLSARTYHKTIKVARTIADLEESLETEERHILEALQYRPSLNMSL
ncbi:MAG: ATP-binding protein, partial [Patescibacteria group bacterium]